MKNNLLKYYIACFYLCSIFIMFAQPGTNNSGGNLEDNGGGDTTPGAPIDGYVWILALVGLVFIFIKYRSIVNRSLNN